jgi:thiamine pyrophosphate-dependent acetolactate synthase large subunit-like protein
MTGLLGYGACYRALHEADLVLLLGTDFPYDDFLPAKNNIQVDIDPGRLGRRAPLAQGRRRIAHPAGAPAAPDPAGGPVVPGCDAAPP